MNEIIEIGIDSSLYPKRLREIVGPPEVLYAMGDISLLNKRAVSVVGSRNCDSYGKKTAYEMGKKLARHGFVHISGMAYGIDYMSHIGALSINGKTIAVLGTGVDVCYPKENIKAYEEIKEKGLLISEFPPGTNPKKHHFPLRNRIIAGMSDALIVVEASNKSGSLITAELANSYNRPVYAIPGNIDSTYSLGSNRLISDGAMILPVLDDIFIDLGKGDLEVIEDNINITTAEKNVFDYVKTKGETSENIIAKDLKLSKYYVKEVVANLEMKGLICYDIGKIYIAKL